MSSGSTKYGLVRVALTCILKVCTGPVCIHNRHTSNAPAAQGGFTAGYGFLRSEGKAHSPVCDKNV